MLLRLVNILNLIHFPLTISQLLDFTAKRDFIDVVEAVALGSDNHGIVVLQEIVVVGHIQPFLVDILIDNILRFCNSVIADEVELVLMAVELQHDGVAAVGQPIDTRKIAIAVVTEIDTGVRTSGKAMMYPGSWPWAPT